jgi:hypothetical protein
MDNKTRLLIYVSTAQLLLQMMAMIITSRKRKGLLVGNELAMHQLMKEIELGLST